jgi:FkbM family methyltransferase
VTSASQTLAPIALFAYRRPVHLTRTLEALRANPEASQTELFVFCDGAKDASAAEGVEAVQKLLQGDLGFAATHIVFRDSNYGLARNITSGVSEVLKSRDRVIVLEDDITVSPFFLRFMNEALCFYRDSPRVGSISGYCYPVADPVPETYLIRGADCWSWATWRDRWKAYDPDGSALLKQLKTRNLCHAFDFDGAMPFVEMLKGQIAGQNDSWAVRWHASCFLRDMLILYPGRALAHNIGQDGSGTHSLEQDNALSVTLSPTPVTVGGIVIEENPQARQAICKSLRRPQPSGTAESAGAGKQPMSLRNLVLGYFPPEIVNVLRGVRRRLRGLSGPRPAVSPVSVAGAPVVEVPVVEEPVAVAEPPPQRYWGLHELDRQIEKYLDFDDGYFVELGANDGCFQSNTLHYEKFRGWHGVLIEPSPDRCQHCRDNRSPRDHVVNAACVSFGYSGQTVELIYSNAMSVSLNVETDIGDPAAHAELGRQFLGPDETVFNFQAPARTLNSILKESDAPTCIDLLSLDVEGAEIEVLKGVDHAAFRFRYMLIECRDIARLSDYLEPLGYRLIEKFNEHDYMFSDQSVAP